MTSEDAIAELIHTAWTGRKRESVDRLANALRDLLEPHLTKAQDARTAENRDATEEKCSDE